MKVLWVQDMDPMVYPGGAELNDRAHIWEGVRRGHEVQVVGPEPNPQALDRPADLVVVSNSMSLPLDAYSRWRERRIPWVIFAHDYGPWVCKWRLFYPMEERCQTLCFLRARWGPILQEARLLIWLSPLHRWAWLYAYPQLEAHPHALVPSAVDVELFHDLGRPRSGVVMVNSLAAFKGADNVIRWAEEHPDVQISHVGGNTEGRKVPPNVRDVGYVPQGKMNELLNSHETFLHLPSTPMPFDRTVVEAFLAGCRIEANELVGALSWDFFRQGREAVRQACQSAPQTFWQEVERCAST